ncbi:DASS family sodium-coupled anion symporter [Propionispora sp. 2/2-37]|uniref:DASS family sodium-coupled anion symporter n=1 Tax=Propionispora sp. 2/2-37 TaxID=1677858 RepID=UPI0006BB74EB|nr:DASS family sodium-coupled anion symporter [Propionispora sp. 2/2-37]
MANKATKGILCLLMGVIIWFLPIPDGVKPDAWHLLAIFTATILAFILQPVPIGAASIMGLTVVVITGVLKPGQALEGFSNTVIWLIVAAFMFAKGFVKTGLGRRIAYLLMSRFGDSTLKLAYTLSATDFIVAPFTPSNTARGGGIIYPITRSLCSAFGSEPGTSAGKVGKFLMLSAYNSVIISACIFLTGASNNVVVVKLTQELFGRTIAWSQWFIACIIPGLACSMIIPYILYKIYPPELKQTPEAKQLAREELSKMGIMTRNEKLLLCIFTIALLLWATSCITGFDPAFVALLGLSLMLIVKVLDWTDVLEEKGAWDVLVWMGILVNMAAYLAKLGLISWFAQLVSGYLSGISWFAVLLLLSLVYVFIHYGFASNTAHVMALFGAFAIVAVAAGAPVLLTAILLGVFANSCSTLTHYACGVSPIFFGSGYITQSEWWRLGFVITIIHLLIWVLIGIPWMKVVGIW